MNTYLVQYYPITTEIGRYMRIDDDLTSASQYVMREKFYENVNASDYYHQSIIIAVKVDNNWNIREETIKNFRTLYRE